MGIIKDILVERNKANKAKKNAWEVEQGSKTLKGHYAGDRADSKAVGASRARAPHGSSWKGNVSVSTNQKAAAENPDELKKIARAKRGNLQIKDSIFLDKVIDILLEARLDELNRSEQYLTDKFKNSSRIRAEIKKKRASRNMFRDYEPKLNKPGQNVGQAGRDKLAFHKAQKQREIDDLNKDTEENAYHRYHDSQVTPEERAKRRELQLKNKYGNKIP